MLGMASINSVRAVFRPDYYEVYWEMDKVNKTFVPIFVVYDPPGDHSYQEVTQELSRAVTWGFHEEGGLVLRLGYGVSDTTQFHLSTTYTSSQSQDPKYLGGGGDGIFGAKMTFSWHVWGYSFYGGGEWDHEIYQAELRGWTNDGDAFVPRADLSNFLYKVSYVPNLRGTIGTFHDPPTGTHTVGPTLSVDHSFAYSWASSQTIDIGALLQINCGIATAYYSISFASGGGQGLSYSTHSHIQDNDEFVHYTINADAGAMGNPIAINDYIMWFNEYQS
jgi:hypothetical protein